MNQKELQKTLSEIKKTIEDSYMHHYRNEYGETASFKILIHDSVLCRSFELDTMIEFNEHEMVDTGNLDYYVEVNITRIRREQEEVCHRLLSFRLMSYPGSHCQLISPNCHHDLTRIELALKLLEFITKLLQSPVIWISGQYSGEEVRSIKDNGYTQLTTVRDPKRMAPTFYFQKVF